MAMTAETGVAPRGQEVQVRLLDSLDQITALRDDWLALENADDTPCFFQSYAWSAHIAEVQSRLAPQSYRPLVAVATLGERLVGLWPLSLQGRSGWWTLCNLDQPFGQFAGLIAAGPEIAQALVVRTLAMVRRRGLARTSSFERVIEGSLLHAALQAAGAVVRGRTQAPVIDLASWSSFDELRQSRNKKSIKNLRNATNRLTRAGEVAHHTARRGPELDALVSRALDNRMAWLEETGLTAPAFRSKAHHDVIHGGARFGLDAHRIGFELTLDGAGIAQQWGFVHRGRYYAYMSGMRADRALLSPGRVQLASVIAAAMDEGCGALEFLTPASDYKLVWTDQVRELVDMSVPLGPLGRLQDYAWNGVLRPAAKLAFYALPAGLRRRALAARHS